jgi:hypothetical protein
MANVFGLNNYDPNMYDPSMYSGPTGAGNNLAQVGIKVTNNNSGGANKVQLFNYLRSIDEIADSGLTTSVPGIFPNITLTE